MLVLTGSSVGTYMGDWQFRLESGIRYAFHQPPQLGSGGSGESYYDLAVYTFAYRARRGGTWGAVGRVD